MKAYNIERKQTIKDFRDFTILNNKSSGLEFCFDVLKNEYYTAVLALTDCEGEGNVTVSGELMSRATVYNCSGVDKYGNSFEKTFTAVKAEIYPLYIGVDFNLLTQGDYALDLQVSVGGESLKISLKFKVSEKEAINHGYNDLTSLSRLNWLNSTRANDNTLVKPFTPIEVSGSTVKILGRDIVITPALNLKSVSTYFDESVLLCSDKQVELLSSAVEFDVSNEKFEFSPFSVNNDGALAEFSASGESENFTISVHMSLTCEGMLQYDYSLIAKNDVQTEIVYSVPFQNTAAKYNFGLGKYGGEYKDIDYKWDDERHDCVFIGNINVGAQIKLKAENYRTPLVNVYYHSLPIIKPETTWDNSGKGSVSVHKNSICTAFKAVTGKISFKKGQTKVFRAEILLTPFKPIDYKKHFTNRYYHSNNMGGKEYKHLEEAQKIGCNILNIHHGNELHPYINYPFYKNERLKRFVDEAHKKGIKIKVYYTCREMSNHTAEVFCYKAFGEEIILRKHAEGLSKMFGKSDWLQKYFGNDVISAWQVHYKRGEHKGDNDIAFIIQPDTRIENYYIEGLQWLVDNIGISGIYIDDTSLDATTLRRAKKVLEKVDGLIDMHMWNHEEPRAGCAVCANIYMEILPFLDSLWIGEGFDCGHLAPDYIFSEVSGLMYGNMSEMLENGGDLYCGMLYGMSNRYGWGVKNTDRIYRVWDAFKIENSVMLGYWHSKNPFSTDNENVLVTSYKNGENYLVCAYNFSEKKEQFEFTINEVLLARPLADYSVIPMKLSKKELVKNRHCKGLFDENILPKRSGLIYQLIQKK